MQEEVILITGANGEIGHGLIRYLAEKKKTIIALDLNPLMKFFNRSSAIGSR